MGAAYRRAQGVGGMVGAGRRVKSKYDAYHLLNLTLIRGAAAKHRLFYGIRGILIHGEAPLSQGHAQHASRFGYGYGAGYVFTKVKYLNGRFRGPIGFKNFAYTGINKKQAFRMDAARLCFYTSVGYIPNPLMLVLYNAPS
jgi:hypothetical protein